MNGLQKPSFLGTSTMAIDALPVTCSECANEFRVKPEATGRSVKCPKCRHQNMVKRNNGDGDGDSSPDAEMEWLGLAPIDDAPPVVPVTAPARMSELEATEPPVYVRHPHSEPRKYPALEIVQSVFRALAVTAGILWLVGSAVWLYAVASADGEAGGLAITAIVVQILGYTLLTVIFACFLVACAEIIRLFIDVQDDTRRTAVYASRIPVK